MTNDIQVGFWVNLSDPNRLTEMTRLYFAASCMYNVDFFVFSANDVDISAGTINGLFWKDGAYTRKLTNFPQLFDLRLGSGLDRRYPEIFSALKRTGYQVSRRSFGTKKKVYDFLLKGEYAHYVIETAKFTDFKHTKDFLHHNKIIILKPNSGANGEGIYKLERISEKKVRVQYLLDVEVLDLQEFLDKNSETFLERNYLMQAYINSTAVDGGSMDIRLNLARPNRFDWEISMLYIRLGGSGYIGVNMGKEQRSTAIAVRESLLYQFGEPEGKRIFAEIKSLARSFPAHFEQSLNFLIPEISVDIGVDRNHNNKLKIFEVQGSPGNTLQRAPMIPMYNMQFYKYLIAEKVYI